MEKLHPCDSQSSGNSLYLEFIFIQSELERKDYREEKVPVLFLPSKSL